MARGPGIHSLPTQDPIQPYPLQSSAPQVADHRRPFFVLCRDNSPQVPEGGDLDEWDHICCECHICSRLCFLLRQVMPLPLHSLLAKGFRVLPAVEGLSCHKCVALGSSWFLLVSLLQDHNCIPYVTVCKVDPEVGPN